MSNSRFPIALSEVENLNLSWGRDQLLTKRIITEKLSVAGSYFTAGSKLADDLGADSVDLVDIIIDLQKFTRVKVNERVHFNYVLELVDYVHFLRTRKK